MDGEVHPTFQAACIALSLLTDDNEYHLCLQEAANSVTGTALRNLFVTILIFCNSANPITLWETYRNHICDDISHLLEHHCLFGRLPTDEEKYDYGLYLIENLLLAQDTTLDRVQMPSVANPDLWKQISTPHSLEGQLSSWYRRALAEHVA